MPWLVHSTYVRSLQLRRKIIGASFFFFLIARMPWFKYYRIQFKSPFIADIMMMFSLLPTEVFPRSNYYANTVSSSSLSISLKSRRRLFPFDLDTVVHRASDLPRLLFVGIRTPSEKKYESTSRLVRCRSPPRPTNNAYSTSLSALPRRSDFAQWT